MKSWRLLPAAALLAALGACDGAAPTTPELRPAGPDRAGAASCGYLGSGICAVPSLPADTVSKTQ